MVSGGATLKVKVRIARVVNVQVNRRGGVREQLKGCGEEWVRYGPNRINTGELGRAIEIALRLKRSFFDIQVDQDDGAILVGCVVHKDTQGIIGRWGTMEPHRRRFNEKGNAL